MSLSILLLGSWLLLLSTLTLICQLASLNQCLRVELDLLGSPEVTRRVAELWRQEIAAKFIYIERLVKAVQAQRLGSTLFDLLEFNIVLLSG